MRNTKASIVRNFPNVTHLENNLASEHLSTYLTNYHKFWVSLSICLLNVFHGPLVSPWHIIFVSVSISFWSLLPLNLNAPGRNLFDLLLIKDWWPSYLYLPWSFIQPFNQLWQRWGHRDTIQSLYQAGLLMTVSESQFQVWGERKRDLEYVLLQRPKVFLFGGLGRLGNFKYSYRRNIFPSVLFSLICLGLAFLPLYVLSLFSRRVSPCRSKALATSSWQFYQPS